MKRTYEIDTIAVNEAIILVENDRKLYDVLITTYLMNLQKKFISGKYDHEQAIKLLELFLKNHALPRLRSREYGWNWKPNPAERYEFAKYFRDLLYHEYLKPLEKNRPKNQKKLSEQLKLKFSNRKYPTGKAWQKEHYNIDHSNPREVNRNRSVPARNVRKYKKK